MVWSFVVKKTFKYKVNKGFKLNMPLMISNTKNTKHWTIKVKNPFSTLHNSKKIIREKKTNASKLFPSQAKSWE